MYSILMWFSGCVDVYRRKMLLLMIGLCVVNVKLLDHPEHIIVGLLLYNYDVYASSVCVCSLRVSVVCRMHTHRDPHAHPHTRTLTRTHVHTYNVNPTINTILLYVLTECVEDV